LSSKFNVPKWADLFANKSSRQNQAVFSQPAKVFTYVVQALEAETLQGQTATRVVSSVKALIQATNTNLAQAAATLTPDQQRTAQAYFS
jgi:hypothetical protein